MHLFVTLLFLTPAVVIYIAVDAGNGLPWAIAFAVMTYWVLLQAWWEDRVETREKEKNNND